MTSDKQEKEERGTTGYSYIHVQMYIYNGTLALNPTQIHVIKMCPVYVYGVGIR